MGLSRDQLLDLYYKLLLSRVVAQRERMLNRLGKGPFAITGEGQEATQVGVTYALRPGQDWVLPYYRDIGVAITIGQTPRDLLLALLSCAEDISSGGRNMPSHFSDPKLKIVSGSAPGRHAGAARRRHRSRLQTSRPRRGHRRLFRRRRHQRWRCPRGYELRRHPQAAGDLRLREQWLRDLGSLAPAVRRRGRLHPRRRLRLRRRHRRWKRRARGLRSRPAKLWSALGRARARPSSRRRPTGRSPTPATTTTAATAAAKKSRSG